MFLLFLVEKNRFGQLEQVSTQNSSWRKKEESLQHNHIVWPSDSCLRLMKKRKKKCYCMRYPGDKHLDLPVEPTWLTYLTVIKLIHVRSSYVKTWDFNPFRQVSMSLLSVQQRELMHQISMWSLYTRYSPYCSILTISLNHQFNSTAHQGNK